jgi:ketosteroid isomerase-like protein
VADWFGSLATERVAVQMDDVQTIVGDGVAVAHALITYQGLSAEGKKLRAVDNRLTWALKQEDGGWKIVHEHTSEPADFEPSKVKLQR